MSQSDSTPSKNESDIDLSLEQLLSELNSEIEGSSRSPSLLSDNASKGLGIGESNSTAPGPKEHYTLSSFPTEMSCGQAFDQLVACYSLGGQMRNIYRYGGISYCDGRFAKLRFCLQLKGIWDEEEKAKRVARYYMQRLAEKKKEVGSSEDVWSVRTVPVSNPFTEDLYKAREDEQLEGQQQQI